MFFVLIALFLMQQAGEGNEGADKEGVDDTLEAMPPKSASQASRSSKASRKKVSKKLKITITFQSTVKSWGYTMFLFVNDSLGQFNMNLKLLQQKVITYYLKLVRCCEIL